MPALPANRRSVAKPLLAQPKSQWLMGIHVEKMVEEMACLPAPMIINEWSCSCKIVQAPFSVWCDVILRILKFRWR